MNRLPLLNLTIPVFNEESRLDPCLCKLRGFLAEVSRWDVRIVIVDNGSTDGTLALAEELAGEYHSVRVMHLEQKGRGRALKAAWRENDADILSYMDVDLSADLGAFPALVKALTEGGSDLAVGSRFLPGSQTRRGWKREFISRCYIRLLKALLHVRFSDAQCGFKAIRREAARRLLPHVEDNGWFFDTELLVLAERLGYRICELPVAWIEDPDSRVRIVSTVWADLKGLMRVRRNLSRGVYADALAGSPPESIRRASIR